MPQISWIDRLIDAARSTHTVFLLTGALAGSVGGWLWFSPPASQDLMYVTFHNHSTQMISSIHLEFGFDLNQSSLLALQIKPGEARTLALNHPAGRGFNVRASYADGLVQEFCANKDVAGRRQHLYLHP